MNTQTVILPRSERLVNDVAREARETGNIFQTDGKRFLLNPFLLPGFFRIGVSIKPQREAA